MIAMFVWVWWFDCYLSKTVVGKHLVEDLCPRKGDLSNMVKKKGSRDINPADAHRWVIPLRLSLLLLLLLVCGRSKQQSCLKRDERMNDWEQMPKTYLWHAGCKYIQNHMLLKVSSAACALLSLLVLPESKEIEKLWFPDSKSASVVCTWWSLWAVDSMRLEAV